MCVSLFASQRHLCVPADTAILCWLPRCCGTGCISVIYLPLAAPAQDSHAQDAARFLFFPFASRNVLQRDLPFLMKLVNSRWGDQNSTGEHQNC